MADSSILASSSEEATECVYMYNSTVRQPSSGRGLPAHLKPIMSMYGRAFAIVNVTLAYFISAPISVGQTW